MDKITDQIWIGNHQDAQSAEILRREGIRSILCLDGCLSQKSPEELGINKIEIVELIDGKGNSEGLFLRAVHLLQQLKAKHPPVLIQCHAGQSRSAAVLCKLFLLEGDTLQQAMKRITSKRKVIINPALQEFLNL